MCANICLFTPHRSSRCVFHAFTEEGILRIYREKTACDPVDWFNANNSKEDVTRTEASQAELKLTVGTQGSPSPDPLLVFWLRGTNTGQVLANVTRALHLLPLTRSSQ